MLGINKIVLPINSFLLVLAIVVACPNSWTAIVRKEIQLRRKEGLWRATQSPSVTRIVRVNYFVETYEINS